MPTRRRFYANEAEKYANEAESMPTRRKVCQRGGKYANEAEVRIAEFTCCNWVCAFFTIKFLTLKRYCNHLVGLCSSTENILIKEKTFWLSLFIFGYLYT